MPENASSRSSLPEEGSEREPGSRLSGPASLLSCEDLFRTLPDRFQDAGARLARELFGAPGELSVEEELEAATADSPWYAGLELEEAWAVGQAFRRLISDSATEIPDAEHRGPEAGDLHAALDRSLLAVARQALERSAEAQRRLVQDVSHDLRSPLNSILLLADALRSQHAESLTAVQSHQVNVLYMAAVTLVRMTNDLIDFSRIGVGHERIVVSKASFSLETAVLEVRSLVGPLASHRGVDVVTVLDAESPRQGDQRLLGRVLLNLVSNAIEAVDPGGSVTVELRDTASDSLRVDVSDDRTGTDVESLRRMLQSSGDGWPGETRGWTRGLGLTIAARLVEAAGGRIDVFGRTGGGSVFRVEMPFRPL